MSFASPSATQSTLRDGSATQSTLHGAAETATLHDEHHRAVFGLRLRAPIVGLPLLIALSNRLMWMGFGVAAIVFSVNDLQANFPDWPRFVLDLSLAPLFTWFPFHPLAYAIVANWAMYVFWFPIFLAWIIKSLVLRFGGVDMFRRLAPCLLGLILGEFSLAMFWALMSMPFIGKSSPTFPWP